MKKVSKVGTAALLAAFTMCALVAMTGCGGGSSSGSPVVDASPTSSVSPSPSPSPSPIGLSNLAATYIGGFTRSAGGIKTYNLVLTIDSTGKISGVGTASGAYVGLGTTAISGSIDAYGNASISWTGVGAAYSHKGAFTLSSTGQLTGTLKEYLSDDGSYVDDVSYNLAKE